ncbi:34 kDa spicule matrix protein-like [Pseudorasbora parva]|uniref:34 kDa spicule matrix protein-like n=1 Tax=Pseudorasbora parva TaxID=51549 RepID=UPI00351F7BBA
MADVSGNFCYKLSDEEIRQFICLKRMHDRLFTGNRNSARDGWTFIIEEMGLQDTLSPQQAGRKWENFKKTYKDLKAPQSGVSTEGGGDTAATWKWFSEIHELQPSVLIASCSENPSVAEREQPGSSAEQPGSSAEQPGSSAEQPGSSAEQPGSSAEQPGSSAEQPGSSAEQPGSSAEQPGSSAEQPGSSAEQPGSSAEQPGSSAEQPGSSAEQPGSSAEQPGSSAEQPGSSRENRGTLREERRPKKRKQ